MTRGQQSREISALPLRFRHAAGHTLADRGVLGTWRDAHPEGLLADLAREAAGA